MKQLFNTLLTLFKRSNSMSSVAWLVFKRLLTASLMYGMRDIITESDCDARARCLAVMFFKPADLMAPAPKTT